MANNPISSPWWNYPIGHGYITSYQGPGTDTPHYADDVETPFHTPITALLSGTVKVADYAIWNGVPGGGEVFVQPDTGGPEYYVYHLDEVDVRAGQHLQAGQLLGLSGGQNTGGEHPVSPRWSSGPHTHVGYFTKFVNTPAGTLPYGPDITPLLHSGLSATATSPDLSQLPQTDCISKTGNCPPQAGGSIADFFKGFVPSADTSYRIGFTLFGFILLLLAIRHFTGEKTMILELPGKEAK